MKLFMLVPEIDENHTALAHLPTWIRGMAKEVDELHVFTLNFNKSTELPSNVKVYCPYRANKLSYFFYINYYILKNVYKTDIIFSLMYPILTIWTAPYAKLFHKSIITWYAHAVVSKKLKKAHFLANMVVTSSKDGCRLESDKIKIIGQAIDTDKFVPKETFSNGIRKILYLGRISPVKGIENIIEAANILVNHDEITDVEFRLVGNIIQNETHENYYKSLKSLIRKYGLENYFVFKNAVPYLETESAYQNCDLFINPSYAGSLEKTVLEAMSCGKIVITSNKAYYNIFNEKMREKCYFEPKNYKELVEKIKINLKNPDEQLKKELRDFVVQNHCLNLWIQKLMNIFNEDMNKLNGGIKIEE